MLGYFFCLIFVPTKTNIMNTLTSFNQTTATIKILQTLQTLRNELGDTIVVDDDVQINYNRFSGVCYMYLEMNNISICADEFGNAPFIQVHCELDDDQEEDPNMTINEFLTWAA